MNDNIEGLYTVLPNVESITKYTVLELNDEINSQITSESKIFHTAVHICQLISINKKKFTTDEYIEYKDLSYSNYMLGNTHVTRGAMAILDVATTSGLFKITTEDNTTIFEFKRVLDVLSPNDNVDGNIGMYLRKFIERALVKNFRKSGQVQVTERLMERFKKSLEEEPFKGNKEFFSIEEKSYCEETYATSLYKSLKNEVREERIYRDIVYSIPLRPGNISVISTPNIRQLLIDVACIVDTVDFKILFLEFTKRIQDWLVNTPLSFDLNIGEEDSKNRENLKLQDMLPSNSPIEDSFRQVLIEDEAAAIIELFDQQELFLIKQLLENKTIEEIAPLVGTKKSATAEKIKKVKKKLGEILTESISNLNNSESIENIYEIDELMVAFSDELNYSRLRTENV